MLNTSNSSRTGAGPMMRGRVRWADFFLGFAIVHASIAELVAEDLRHAAQLTRVLLPQPPLEQQQVGGRVALVDGVQVLLHLGQGP